MRRSWFESMRGSHHSQGLVGKERSLIRIDCRDRHPDLRPPAFAEIPEDKKTRRRQQGRSLARPKHPAPTRRSQVRILPPLPSDLDVHDVVAAATQASILHERFSMQNWSDGQEVAMLARFSLGLVTLMLAALPVHAQSVADFYRGRTVQLLIGYTAGGGYDLNARVLARHIGKHIPGNPNVVPQNMAGAG